MGLAVGTMEQVAPNSSSLRGRQTSEVLPENDERKAVDKVRLLTEELQQLSTEELAKLKPLVLGSKKQQQDETDGENEVMNSLRKQVFELKRDFRAAQETAIASTETTDEKAAPKTPLPKFKARQQGQTDEELQEHVSMLKKQVFLLEKDLRAARKAAIAALTAPSTTNVLQTKEDGLQLDIMVGLSGLDPRLKRFAKYLGEAIAEYPQTYTQLLDEFHQQDPKDWEANDVVKPITKFRLLTTRYTQDEKDASAKLRQEIASLSGLPLEDIIFVPSPANVTTFARAHALNMLHKAACSDANCLATALDVDLKVGPEFFFHAAEYTQTGKKTYFPDVFWQHDPSTVRLVHNYLELVQQEKLQENYTGDEELVAELTDPFGPHYGFFGDYGNGMYVLGGPDLGKFLYDESFVGWGGEDHAFSSSLRGKRKRIRREERGLIHVWHPRHCILGKTVMTQKIKKFCHVAARKFGGSDLGRYLIKKWRLGVEEKAQEEAAQQIAAVADGNQTDPTTTTESKTDKTDDDEQEASS